jgi:hypothetical protein
MSSMIVARFRSRARLGDLDPHRAAGPRRPARRAAARLDHRGERFRGDVRVGRCASRWGSVACELGSAARGQASACSRLMRGFRRNPAVRSRYDFHVDRTAILNFAAAIAETIPSGTPRAGRRRWRRDRADLGVAAARGIGARLRGTRKIPPRVEPPASEAKPRSGGGGGGGLTRVLHGEQRFEYHKPMQPGMKLRVTTRPGKVWEKEGKKGGKLKFNETVSEYRDESGDLVLVATSVGVLTEKAVEQ